MTLRQDLLTEVLVSDGISPSLPPSSPRKVKLEAMSCLEDSEPVLGKVGSPCVHCVTYASREVIVTSFLIIREHLNRNNDYSD